MATVLNVTIHSDINEFPTEKRYDPAIKISELKKKLELITGANHKTMELFMTINDDEPKKLDDEEQTLSHYTNGKTDQINLTVKDTQSKSLLEGDVPKYEIPEDKYSQRKDNARDFIRKMRGQVDESI